MHKKSNYAVSTAILAFFLFVITISSVSAGVSGFANVDIISNCPQNQCPLFNNPNGVWVFQWIDNGFTSEILHARFDKEDDLTVDNKVAAQDFSISINSLDQFCTYDINREPDREDVYLFELKEISESFWPWQVFSLAEISAEVDRMVEEAGCSKIKIGGKSDIAKGIEVSGTIKTNIDVACWRIKDVIGQAGSLQNLKYDFETEFVLSSDGKQDIKKTLTYKSGEEILSQELSSDAYVIWEGSLVSGETCPTGPDDYVTFNPNFFEWKITDKTNYVLYESKLSDLSRIALSFLKGETSIRSAENSINSFASNAVADRQIAYSPIIDSTSASSGRLKIKLGKKIVFPQFRLFVDSDYLELEISTGIPELSKDFLGNCKPDSKANFNMGDLFGGQFDVGLKNIGTQLSSFIVNVKSCTNPLISPGVSDILQLDGGQLDNAKLSIVGQLEDINNAKGSCTIEAKDIVSGVKDTCKISVDISKPASCVEGRQSCSIVGNNHVIKTCVSGDLDTTDICRSKEVCDYNDQGAPVCVATGDDDVTGLRFCEDKDAYAKSLLLGKVFKSLECKPKLFHNFFFAFFSILRLFAVPFFFIIALLFSFRFIDKLMKEQYKAVSWVLSIVIAFLVAILTYIAFYIGLVLFAIIVVVWFIIRLIPGNKLIRRVI